MFDVRTLSVGDTAFFKTSTNRFGQAFKGRVAKVSETGQITIAREGGGAYRFNKFGSQIGGSGYMISEEHYESANVRRDEQIARVKLQNMAREFNAQGTKEQLLQTLREMTALVEINIRSQEA